MVLVLIWTIVLVYVDKDSTAENVIYWLGASRLQAPLLLLLQKPLLQTDQQACFSSRKLSEQTEG
jgi:hypothetical protein